MKDIKRNKITGKDLIFMAATIAVWSVIVFFILIPLSISYARYSEFNSKIIIGVAMFGYIIMACYFGFKYNLYVF